MTFLLTLFARYEHYFQKDVALQHATGEFSGHRHEWENIVIWVKDGANMPSYVSASQHDGYQTKEAKDVRFQGMSCRLSGYRCNVLMSCRHPCQDRVQQGWHQHP